MNANDTEAAGMNPETVTNDLTQLSSREQLSALMDGALPADQTRFLLRRLQHDAPLAECWERWRLTGEVMRGLAPTQRLPTDFAVRVGAALRGDAPPQSVARPARTRGWLRWGGGIGMVAASLAVVTLMARQPMTETPSSAASIQTASTSPLSNEGPAPSVPVSTPQLPTEAGNAAQSLVVASVAAAAGSRPIRNRDRARSIAPTRMQAVATSTASTGAGSIAAADGMLDNANPNGIPQPDIVTRPWPRSVLPQYASGALVVGFGAHAQGATAYDPFKSQAELGSLPLPAAPADRDSARQSPAANADPQRDAQAKP